MKKPKVCFLNSLLSKKGWLSLGMAIISLVATVMPTFADFSDSPSNYVPAISDVYVCNVDGRSISKLNGVTGAIIKTIALPAGAKPFGIAFRPDYSTAYVTDTANGKVYRIGSDRVLTTINTPSSYNNAISIHPNGRFAYISSSAGVLILDTNSSSPTFNTITGIISGCSSGSIVFTPDGTRAYASIDGNYGSVSQIKVINTSSHTIVNTIQLPIPTAPQGVAVSPDGKRVYVSGWVSQKVSVIDTDTTSPTYNTVTAVIPVSGEARGIALSPTGNLAYITLDTGGVDVIVTAPSSHQFNQVIAHIPDAGPYGGIHGVASSLDGRFTYVTVANGQNKVYVIDSEPFSATFNSTIGTFTVGITPLGVAVKPH
jgi:YVTN family beta-propeller protein